MYVVGGWAAGVVVGEPCSVARVPCSEVAGSVAFEPSPDAALKGGATDVGGCVPALAADRS